MLESEKIVKPVLLALFSCLVSKMIFLDLFSLVCIPFLFYLVLPYLCFCCKTNFHEFFAMSSACSYYFMIYVCCLVHFLFASHSCIIVTEPSENEPVEPAESVEPEPGVPFVVESEANPGKQLSMIPCSYLWLAAIKSFFRCYLCIILCMLILFYDLCLLFSSFLNSCIAFMHFSDRTVGERTRGARRVRRA